MNSRMDSRQAQTLLPDYTAGCLDADCEAAVRAWIEECPECQKEWQSVQATLLILSTTTQPLLSVEDSQRMWDCCEAKLREKIFESKEAKRLAEHNPSLWGWMRMQPRWGWAALGGAVAVLGTVWLIAPNPANNSGTDMQYAAVGSQNVGELQMFREPPPAASTLVNHHSGMPLDPFADHVGSTLVSYSATAP